MLRIIALALIGSVALSAAAIALSASATKTPEPSQMSAAAIERPATFQERWDALNDLK
jgi:hypothetical protein